MHQHLGPASSPSSNQVKENSAFAEIEALVDGTSSKSSQNDNIVKLYGAVGRRHGLTWLLLSGLVLIAALVPAGLKSSELLAKVAHSIVSE